VAVQEPTSSTPTARPTVGPLLRPRPLSGSHHIGLPSLDLRQLPVLARFVGHLVLGLVLMLAASEVFPLRMDAPRTAFSIAGAVSGSVAAGASRQTGSPVVEAAAVVEPAVLPSTVRSLRGVIVPVAAPRRPPRSEVVNYTVQQGDNIVRIAHAYGLEVSTVLWANPALEDDPDLLSIGQVLRIPPVDGTLYTVVHGDSIEAIAAKHKVEADAIVAYPANNLASGENLPVGQVLVIPGGIKPVVPKPTATPRPAPVRVAPTAVPAAQPAPPSSVPTASGSLGWPMQGVITQGYWNAGYASHPAIDIAAAAGTPIYAADSGYVSHVQWNVWPYGTMITISHSDGSQTLYAHMSALNVQEGQTVSKGDQIGACGSTGRSTGPHLHFEVRRNGTHVNPLAYLP